MTLIDEREYNRLAEDYEELKQTNKACETEYKRLVGNYNKVVEQNKILQKCLRKIKNMLSADFLNSVAIARIKEFCNIV